MLTTERHHFHSCMVAVHHTGNKLKVNTSLAVHHTGDKMKANTSLAVQHTGDKLKANALFQKVLHNTIFTKW